MNWQPPNAKAMKILQDAANDNPRLGREIAHAMINNGAPIDIEYHLTISVTVNGKHDSTSTSWISLNYDDVVGDIHCDWRDIAYKRDSQNMWRLASPLIVPIFWNEETREKYQGLCAVTLVAAKARPAWGSTTSTAWRALCRQREHLLLMCLLGFGGAS
ncbi:MAG: hypothetical protein KAI73_10480 [Rhodospirillaceae bacterium]|nr:hypothetical protein [Rhodospirillaceae bacterium]